MKRLVTDVSGIEPNDNIIEQIDSDGNVNKVNMKRKTVCRVFW